MIKKLMVENFRSLKNVEISFEDDITVLVGENDSGKTSIVDALKIMFDNKTVEEDDFYYGTNKIRIVVETDDKTFIKEFEKNDGDITLRTSILFSKSKLERICNYLNSDKFNSLADNDKKSTLTEIANKLGVKFKSNIKANTLKDRVLGRLDIFLRIEEICNYLESDCFNSLSNEKKEDILKEYAEKLGIKLEGDIEVNKLKDKVLEELRKFVYNDGRIIVEGNIPKYHVYFLDGKHFEDISKFIKEMFFKEKIENIWKEKISEEKTIEEFILEKLKEYSENIERELKEGDVVNKLKKYLPKLEDIKIEPIFTSDKINADIKPKLLENCGEIPIHKKGDGTKRRITMALLECKKSKQEEQPTLYVFDEPDTHLHVRAQRDLLRVIEDFYKSGNQVIITTHSPFIMNSVEARKIRLLSLKNGETKIKKISHDKVVEKILKDLGIENIYLFFARKILIVEGETEEVFIPKIYEKFHGTALRSDLIKLINRKSVDNIPKFAEVLHEFIKPEDIIILVDNDIDENAEEIINKLNIPKENIFKIGYKEFEDAFEPEVIYESWKQYVIKKKGEKLNKEWLTTKWTIENISKIREECIKNSMKFSKKLKSLNAESGAKMTKPKLAEALAEYCEWEHLPKELQNLLERLRE
ncbi:ATP-dependent nuclease [Methanocaldococcus fervens]|uniref:SMC domain protein n=1 Tax=Methanocaldococcus fervens (strain DSM 4213 / JCM 15782 / AG86) TaxID=573064 RepID=C7P8D3_METFA|nr:AAA family ATPase [Methanocaldococcus fervens]ACV24815.1 SMC domain protein [Methanocaldococcus fervens AG86]